jgi:hypothetical protein
LPASTRITSPDAKLYADSTPLIEAFGCAGSRPLLASLPGAVVQSPAANVPSFT